MSEGELKNRILYAGKPFMDLYWEFKDILDLHDRNIEIHLDPTCEYYVKKVVVDKILDEAKQEFPLGKVSIDTYYTERVRMEEWFKKWFGEP